MFANFFIDRPIFAWVIAILITFSGILALRALPVSQYPSVAPPTLNISVTYPGASAQVVEQSAVQLIEQEMNGIENLLYMESSSQVSSGQVSLTFRPGTDIQFASVEAQNRIKRVEARLPDDVRRLGVTVTRAGRNFIMVVALVSPDVRQNAVDLGSYATASVLEPLLRVPGVGEVLLFGTEYSMRIWLKPDRLEAYALSPADVGRAGTGNQRRARQPRAPRHPGGIRRHRGARQSGRLVRAPQGHRAHRTGRAGLQPLRAPQRPAYRRHGDPHHAGSERAGDRAGRARQDAGTVALLPAGRGVDGTLRHHALHRAVHPGGDEDPAGGGGAGGAGDVHVPRQLAHHADPGHRRAGVADGRAAGAVYFRLLDQRADAVRDGAGDRHRGGRCHRGGGERRAQHARQPSRPARGDAAGDEGDHRGDHRDHAGADGAHVR